MIRLLVGCDWPLMAANKQATSVNGRLSLYILKLFFSSVSFLKCNFRVGYKMQIDASCDANHHLYTLAVATR